MKRELIFLLLLMVVAPLEASEIRVSKFQNPGDSIVQGRNFNYLMQNNHRSSAHDVYSRLDTSDFMGVISNDIDLPLKVITIVSAGDVMPGTNFPDESYLPPDCTDLFASVRPIIQDADIAIANLEGVFSSSGGTPKNCNDPKTCYVFRMPDIYAECISEAGFDILGVANNHVNDFGYVGRINTARTLDNAGISFAGFNDRATLIYNIRGITIGFCAFAPHTGTLDFKDYEAAARTVSELKAKTDIVIVNFHAGAEGSMHQHITRADEIFLGHNRGNPWYFAHKVIDAGADLVVGHGPHVVRATEFYKGKLIAYSLGNFCTYARFNLSGPNAYAPLLEVKLKSNGEFVSGKIHSFIQLGEGGPVPDPAHGALKRIRELTVVDFPDGRINIDESGEISY